MKIVIDIPEKIYNDIRTKNEHGIIFNAVKNGTPLPEHHGRLIDADELKKHKYHDSDRFENAVAVAQIDWAPTIIEGSDSK